MVLRSASVNRPSGGRSRWQLGIVGGAVLVVMMWGLASCSSDVSARDGVEAQLAASGSENERLQIALGAANTYSDESWSHLLLGEQRTSLLEYSQAVPSLVRAVELDGDDALARGRLGEVLMAVGRDDEALDQLRVGFDNGLGDEWRETEGVLLSRMERYEDLLALADVVAGTSAVESDPSLPDRQRYVAHRGLGDQEAADRSLVAARRAEPDLARLQAGAAAAEYDKARFRSAQEYAEFAGALDPTSGSASYEEGRALLQLGRLDEALARFQALTALSPDRTEGPVFEALTLVQLGRPDEAVEIMDRVAESFADLPGVHGVRAEALAAAGDATMAMEAAGLAIEINPDDPLALLGLASAQLASGDPGSALATIQEVVARRSTVSGRPEAVLAEAAIQLGRSDIAVGAATQAATRAPGLWQRQLLLARAYDLAGIDSADTCAAAAKAADTAGVVLDRCP